MIISKGKGNHGVELSQDVIDFLTHCYNNSASKVEAGFKANINYNIMKRVIETKRCSQVTLNRIQEAMKKQEVC